MSIRTILALCTVSALCLGTIPAATAAPATPAPHGPAPAPAEALGALPMTFEPNLGQVDPQVRFVARGRGYSLFMTAGEAVLALAADEGDVRGEQRVLRLRFEGARVGVRPEGVDRLESHSNYLRGDDLNRWVTDVPNFAGVRLAGVYPGVDVVFSGRQGELRYALDVATGADLGAVRMTIDGADSIAADGDDLVLRVGGHELRQRPPVVRERGGARRAGGYVVGPNGSVGFRAGAGEPEAALTVAPSIVFATLLGGDVGLRVGDDEANDVAVDAAGNLYVVGWTDAPDFPRAGTPVQSISGGGRDAYVAKLDPLGQSLVYSTFLGGSQLDVAHAVAVGSDGSAFVAGETISPEFPTTPGALQTQGRQFLDGFVVKLNPQGSAFAYATYLGGDDYDIVYGLAVDAAGNAYATGETGSQNFPVTPGAYDTFNTGLSAFVAKINPTATALVYSTFLGGSQYSGGKDVAVTPAGEAVVVGVTDPAETPFPTTPGAFDTTPNGNRDAFVTKFDASGAALVYSTLLGGAFVDEALAVGLDGGEVVVGGYTEYPQEQQPFPTTPGAFDRTHSFSYDGFLTRVAANGASLVSSTLMGSEGYDQIRDLAIGAGGTVYVTGTTSIFTPESAPFPTTPGAFSTTISGAQDAFVAKFAAGATGLAYSTFLGGGFGEHGHGIAVDAAGAAFVVGSTEFYQFGDGRQPFPTVSGSFDSVYNGGLDSFATKINPSGSTLTYSTFIAGSYGKSKYDFAYEAALGADGSVYIAGYTSSQNFPTTPGAYDPELQAGNSDVFITKLAADGTSLVYSTFLGGYDSGSIFMDAPGEYATGLVVDAAGNASVTGYTTALNFPTTFGAYDTTPNGNGSFVTRLNAAGNGLVFSTIFDNSVAGGLALDAAGAVYITGYGWAETPTTPGAFQTVSKGNNDAFVAKFAPDGSALLYATLLSGDSIEFGQDIAVDPSGNAVVAGVAYDPLQVGLPVTPGAFDTTDHLGVDGFVAKFNADGSNLIYATYLGGDGSDFVLAVAVDAAGAAYVTGNTDSFDVGVTFPTTPGAFDTTHDPADEYNDAFVTKLNPAGSALEYSTLLGGSNPDSGADIAVDAAGLAFVTGDTTDFSGAEPFPTTPDAIDATLDWRDAFVTQVNVNGSGLAFSTLFGGSASEFAAAIATDGAGTIVVTGTTNSLVFPTVNPIQSQLRGDFDVYVAKLSVPARQADTPGVYVGASGAWFLRNASAPGGADAVFTYGAGGSLVPLVGDWNGDGVDTPGLYDPSTGAFILRNANAGGGADLVFTFGAGGQGFVPLSGDWNGDGVDTIGLYVPATGVFFLRDSNSPGGANAVFTFGPGGAGFEPISGDWNGDDADTIGLYAPATGTFFLRNANAPGGADAVFGYGPAGAAPITGDWNGDGVDTVGVYLASGGAWFLRNANAPGAADLVFSYGPSGVTALAGNWDGQ